MYIGIGVKQYSYLVANAALDIRIKVIIVFTEHNFFRVLFPERMFLK